MDNIKLIYVSRNGSKYEQDNDGFLLRNGQRDWFKSGNTFLYAGMIEKERRDFQGFVRVHDVRISGFSEPREFLKEGVYLLGITPQLLAELKTEFRAKDMPSIHAALHNQNPTQEYPHSSRSSEITDCLVERVISK